MLTPTTLAQVSYRAISVLLVVDGIGALPLLNDAGRGFHSPDPYTVWALILGPVVAGLSLWFSAVWLAERTVIAAEGDAHQEPLTVGAVESIALTMVGLFLVLLPLPVVLAELYHWITSGSFEYWIESFIRFSRVELGQLFVGLVLLLWQRYWLALLRRTHGIHSRDSSSNPDIQPPNGG